jgi:uncharacterized protein
MKRWNPIAFFFAVVVLLAGCSTLDEKQRAWIFQPSDRSWGGASAAAEGMEDIWISFKARSGGEDVRLHGLWLPADGSSLSVRLSGEGEAGRASTPALAGQSGVSGLRSPPALPASLVTPDSLATPKTLALPNPLASPVLLYLHGARYNVTGSAPRMRRLQELGFSVLAIDYRGFGKSTNKLPSETSAYEDARAAWDWLAKKFPDNPRYIFGHSLGGSIAIHLASEVGDEKGTIVESTFTSIADVVKSTEWGWVPLSMLLTQRFEAVGKVGQIGSPLLVMHGDSDRLILPDLGKRLYEAAAEPKRFVLVKGGSHHNTNLMGQAQLRTALGELMNIKAPDSITASSETEIKLK